MFCKKSFPMYVQDPLKHLGEIFCEKKLMALFETLTTYGKNAPA